MIQSTEDRRMTNRLASLSFSALILAALLGLASIQAANRTVRDAYAGIIATVAQKYPDAEAEVVRDIQGADMPAAATGYQILSRYGMDEMGVQENEIAASLAWRVIPFGVGFTALLAVAYFLMLSHYRRRISAHIEELSKYIRRLDSGDYSLDIRDNGEGSLSQLKNDLYKITVRLREQAQILKREKLRLSDAIADISHQIKTPLTSLSVLADLLSGDPPEADRRTFVEQLRPQLGRIQWLITALLKLSRLDAGTAGLKREPVNILRLIEHAIEPLRIPMELKGQQITVRGDPSAGFQGDFQWSAEALTNLVKNGVEHSQEGGRIEISFRANPLYAEIQVTDHGEGIASEDQPLIFNRFFRGKNAGEYSIGIGLALAKAIFLEQGGDITVASQPGQGTTFTVKVFQGIT